MTFCVGENPRRLGGSRRGGCALFAIVGDRLFPEAGMAVPRMPLYWCGFQGSMFDVSTFTGVVAREVGKILATESTESTEGGQGVLAANW